MTAEQLRHPVHADVEGLLERAMRDTTRAEEQAAREAADSSRKC
jgi:hypothetical protein